MDGRYPRFVCNNNVEPDTAICFLIKSVVPSMIFPLETKTPDCFSLVFMEPSLWPIADSLKKAQAQNLQKAHQALFNTSIEIAATSFTLRMHTQINCDDQYDTKNPSIDTRIPEGDDAVTTRIEEWKATMERCSNPDQRDRLNREASLPKISEASGLETRPASY